MTFIPPLPIDAELIQGNPVASTNPADGQALVWQASTQQYEPRVIVAGSYVSSVAGRSGAVSLAVADVSGAAPLASPALSGAPTAPTAAAGTTTAQVATCAFVLASLPGMGAVWLIHPDGTSSRYAPSANTDVARGVALTAAIAASASGDVVALGVGTHDLNGMALTPIPAGVALVGRGRTLSAIYSTATGAGLAVAIGSGGSLRGLTLRSPSGDCIVQSAGQTGVIVEGCDLSCGSTGVHAEINAAAGDLTLMQCRFFSTAGYLFGVGVTVAGATLRLQGCLWLATNSPTFGEIYSSAGSVEVYGGAIRSAAATHAKQAGSGSILLAGLEYDPAKVSGAVSLGTIAGNVSGTSSGGGGGGMAVGGAVTGGTAGELLYVGVGGVLAQAAGITTDGSTLSSPGAGTNSEHLGAGSASAGASSVAIGYQASAAVSGAVAIGHGATVPTGNNGVAIGQLSSAGDSSFALGSQAAANTSQAVAVGVLAVASSADAIAIGYSATATAFWALAIGNTASAPFNGSMAFGTVTTADLANQVKFGNPTIPTHYLTLGGVAPQAEASAPNGTLFVSSTTGKLSWKDTSGVVNALY